MTAPTTSAAVTPVPVKIYTTNYCGYCVAAKRLLQTRAIAFTEEDVSGDDAKRAWLVQTTGRRTVPQIFIGDRPIGGFDDLSALDASGELAKMLAR